MTDDSWPSGCARPVENVWVFPKPVCKTRRGLWMRLWKICGRTLYFLPPAGRVNGALNDDSTCSFSVWRPLAVDLIVPVSGPSGPPEIDTSRHPEQGFLACSQRYDVLVTLR